MTFKDFFQDFGLVVVGLYYKIFFRIKVVGRENIPKGGCIVCANHPTIHDPLMILTTLGPRHDLSSMGKKELFDNKFLGFVLTVLGAFPVDRENIDVGAIKRAINDINAGKKFVIFPEGTRTPKSDGKAKGGVSLIALKSGKPILPIHVETEDKLFGKVTLTFGECLNPPKKEDKIDYQEFAQSILEHIWSMGEQNEN